MDCRGASRWETDPLHRSTLCSPQCRTNGGVCKMYGSIFHGLYVTGERCSSSTSYRGSHPPRITTCVGVPVVPALPLGSSCSESISLAVSHFSCHKTPGSWKNPGIGTLSVVNGSDRHSLCVVARFPCKVAPVKHDEQSRSNFSQGLAHPFHINRRCYLGVWQKKMGNTPDDFTSPRYLIHWQLITDDLCCSHLWWSNITSN